MKYVVAVGGQSFEIEVDHDHMVWVDGRPLYVNLEQVGGLPVYSLAVEDQGHVLFVDKSQEGYQVEVKGKTYRVKVDLQRPRLTPPPTNCPDGSDACLVISAPLAGQLVSLPVSIGDQVEARQVIAVVESMKMQMELRAPRAGSVEAIHKLPDQDVGQGEELVTLRAG